MIEIPKYSLLAVSGGADSMYMLHRYKYVEGIHVAHVNYNIRPDSTEDSKLVERFCAMYDIPCHVHTVHNPPESGVEEWAREVRYEFFSQLINEHSLSGVVTAHNANDQAETVLMRIHRGSGIKGLCGIHHYNKKFKAYRPLLGYTKSYIYQECRKYKIPYREDSTNSDSTYTRNWFRNKYLEEEMIDTLSHVASIAQEIIPELNKFARDAYSDLITFEGDKLYIPKNIESNSLLFFYISNVVSNWFSLSENIFERMFSDDPSTNRFNITSTIYCNKRKKRWIIIEGLK